MGGTGQRALEPGLKLRTWRLDRRIGRGGEAEVWQATDGKDRAVALKILPRGAPGREKRLRQEFERLRTLRLPSVVRVLDVGTDQGWMYVAMELCAGEPFGRYVAHGHALASRVRRAATAGAGVARALVGIHRLGLAHRDLKPPNVLVDSAGRVTLLDFGLARAAGRADSSSEFLGTVAWMSPEQRIGLPTDQAVDCYALGLLLHESLSGTPVGQGQPGRPRSSLALLGPEVPLALAALVDRLLALDPFERPPAEEAEAVLSAVASGAPLDPAPWPSPLVYAGDPAPLLEGSAVVVGLPGSGRRRMVDEARWLWYRRGYPSVAGRCVPDVPYGAVREVLARLFADRDPAARRTLAGDELPVLRALWPELPVPAAVVAPWPPDPVRAADALARMLGRKAPLAVVLWDTDQADPGTAEVLPLLVPRLPDGVLLWGTSRSPFPPFRARTPPSWGPRQEDEVLPSILPSGVRPVGPPAPSPLESAARAWRALARVRREPGPVSDFSPGLVQLAALEPGFPRDVALALTREAEDLIAGGHVLAVPPPAGGIASGAERFRFADEGTLRLARARQVDPAAIHPLAAQAWRRVAGDPDQPLRTAYHAVRAGRPRVDVLAEAALRELDRRNPAQILRWVQLKDLVSDDEDDVLLGFARLFAAVELEPGRVSKRDIQALAARATSPGDRARAGYLALLHEYRSGDRAKAATAARRWADKVSPDDPGLAADMLQVGALAMLAAGDSGESGEADPVDEALRDCREALALAREAAWREEEAQRKDQDDVDEPTTTTGLTTQPAPRGGPSRLSETEVSVAITLSAALLCAGRYREAEKFCGEMAARCQARDARRGEGAMLSNLGLCRLYLGRRDEAADAVAAARNVQRLHRDPVVLANCTTLQARLSVERGDLSGGRLLLDEAMTLAYSLADDELLSDAWTLQLESATQTADASEAQRAISGHDAAKGHARDHWPAVNARWLWLRGKLDLALEATAQTRLGHAGFLVHAERCRLLLVSGKYDEAAREGGRLADRALAADMGEIAVFGRLVAGAAGRAPDSDYLPLVQGTRTSRWVHLYLGALHMDAIRRQLRGENVGPLVRQLLARATDLDHKLYMALGREEGW